MEKTAQKTPGKERETSYAATQSATHAMEHEKEFQKNIAGLKEELNWLSNIISERLKEHREGQSESTGQSVTDIEALKDLPESSYNDFIKEKELTGMDRLLIALAFAAEYAPQIVSQFLTEQTGPAYRAYGGQINTSSGEFYPTLRTALFLLGGSNFEKITCYKVKLSERYRLFKEQIIHLYYTDNNAALYTDPKLVLDPSYHDYFITGKKPRLDHGSNFPAQLLETEKTFEDLVLKESVLQDLSNIKNYVTCHQELFANEAARRIFTPGYVCMFYGPPGTGKSLTAAVLGKQCKVPVYRIDLSRIISKYIGETEKNLERVFARLEGKNVILFFDEADALFGKRTEITDAKDRYANQEVSYLLQRIEKWHGVVLLATNYRQNLDEAFKRRILKSISFEQPGKEELQKLWKGHMPEGFAFESEELVNRLSGMYPFTGANIASVLKKACIEALQSGSTIINVDILNPLIREECNQNGLMQYHRPLTRN